MPETFLNKAQLTGLSADARRTEILRARSAAALPLGEVARATATANQTGITSVIDLTGLSVTWTADASRLYKISFLGDFYSSVANDICVFQLTDSGNTQLARATGVMPGTNTSLTFSSFFLQSGTGGPITRKLRAWRVVGTGNMVLAAASNTPAYLLVEDIGLA